MIVDSIWVINRLDQMADLAICATNKFVDYRANLILINNRLERLAKFGVRQW